MKASPSVILCPSDTFDNNVLWKRGENAGGRRSNDHDPCKQYYFTDLLKPKSWQTQCQTLNWIVNSTWEVLNTCWRSWDGICFVWAQTCRINVNHGGIPFEITCKQWNWCGRSVGHTHPHSLRVTSESESRTSWTQHEVPPHKNDKGEETGLWDTEELPVKWNQVWFYKKQYFACRTLEKTGWFWIYNACHCKNDTLGMFLPKCVIMAAAEVRVRLMCVRCYLSSSSSSSRRERARTRVRGQHNERDIACQLGQLLL